MRYLLCFLLLLTGTVAIAQPAYFNERFSGTPAFTMGTDVLPINGGYWLTGQCNNSQTFGYRTLFLQRFDTSGQPSGPLKRWEKPYTSYYQGAAGGALQPLPDGGMILSGSVKDSSRRNHGQLWRFSPLGDTLWTRTYSATFDMILYNYARTSDGGIALIGVVDSALDSDRMDVLLLRTDSLGRERWRQTYHIRRTDYGYFINTTPDGGFLLTGFTTHFFGSPSPSIPYNPDVLVIKTDSLGRKQWHTTLGGSYKDTGGPALALPDGGYVVSGCWTDRIVNSGSQARAALFWLDSTGHLLRRRSYGPARWGTELYTLLRQTDGSLVAAGQSSDTANAVIGGGYQNGIALKVCAAGDSVWYRTYQKLTGGRSYNYLRDFRPTPDGGFVGAGFLWVRPPDTGTNDAWLFKVDQHGYLQAGDAAPTVRCAPLTGAVPDAPAAGMVALSPNPTLPDGRFTLEAPMGATVVLTDALGHEVWRASHLSPRTADLALPHSGLYLLRLTWPDGRTVTRKLVRE